MVDYLSNPVVAPFKSKSWRQTAAFFYPAQENPPVELSVHMLPIPDPMKLEQLINFLVFWVPHLGQVIFSLSPAKTSFSKL
jgi:hypothetical protein